MRLIVFTFFTLLILSCAEKRERTVFDSLTSGGSSLFQSVMNEKDKYEVQILFSPITRRNDSIIVEDHFFNYRPGEYFYPASVVKMPTVFMALQKLEELRSSGLDIDLTTPLRIDSIRPLHTSVFIDSTQENGKPTLGHYIDKVFSVSENDAYNRLFEFCGTDYINAGLRAKGIFTNSRIIHRVGVSGYSYEENKHTPPIHFLNDKEDIIYTNMNPLSQGFHITIVENTKKGIGYIEDGKQIDGPFDFSQKNFININDLQESLKRVVLPELYFPGQRYTISEPNRKFVLESMAKLPKDHRYLKGKTKEYYDSYCKFFLFGDSKEPIPEHIIIQNKVGIAYGYLTDCAYIRDTKEEIEYFLTATILVNENQVYNDGIYEYEEIGIPFLAELGRLAHNYMIKRKDERH